MSYGGAGPVWASKEDYDHDVAVFWAMRRRYEGYRAPMTTSQHILWLLITVFTGGLGAIGWIIFAARGRRVPGDPTAPVPVWPPPAKS